MTTDPVIRPGALGMTWDITDGGAVPRKRAIISSSSWSSSSSEQFSGSIKVRRFSIHGFIEKAATPEL